MENESEVKVVSIVTGALGSVSKSLGKWIDKLGYYKEQD